MHFKSNVSSWFDTYHSPNTGKYGPEKTPYLDIFHTMYYVGTVGKYSKDDKLSWFA